MQKKTKVPSEIRIQVVKKYLAGEITMARMENDFLKKLKEIERR